MSIPRRDWVSCARAHKPSVELKKLGFLGETRTMFLVVDQAREPNSLKFAPPSTLIVLRSTGPTSAYPMHSPVDSGLWPSSDTRRLLHVRMTYDLDIIY